MLEQSTRTCNLPGYTGHIPEVRQEEQVAARGEAIKHIPGYGGYCPGVKSENLYG